MPDGQAHTARYETEDFAKLEAEHVRHRMAGLGIIDPDCLWCNGYMARWWRAVNRENDDD